MLSLEEVMKGLEYIDEKEIENPEWTLEKMQMIHDTLTDDNFMSYVVYLSLRPDLPEDDRDTCLKLIKIKRALENREIQKRYSHFNDAGAV